MDITVATVVLLAALAHAGWNALVKVNADPLITITMVAAAQGLIAAAALPFVAFPASDAWPFLLISVGLHTGYNLFLATAYRHGDLGQVYPLARGTAPLLVTLASVVIIGEYLAPSTLAAVGLLTAGVISLSFRGGRLPFLQDPRPVAYALVTASFIASYTVVDGMGARAGPTPHGYAAWLFAIDGLVMAVTVFVWRGRPALETARRCWRPGLMGGAMSLAAYWLVIWAMTKAPLAPVAALRETSVVFGTLLAFALLHEKIGRWRLIATALVVLGVVMLRI